MPIQVATAPVSWGVMEVEGFNGQKSYGEVLDEMVQAGYTGTELGPYGFLPTDPKQLKSELTKRGLSLLGAFVPLPLAQVERHEAAVQSAMEVARLLAQSGALLGIAPEAVTLTRLATLMDPARAELAAARSAQLRGLLHELQREHACNRALMRLELSFLDHLMTSLALDGAHGYDPHGSTSSTSNSSSRSRGALHVLDLRA